MKYHLILTGDVIHSRKHEVSKWLPILEESLAKYATTFDIFRGDSFQAEVLIENAFTTIFYLKSALRQVEGMDIRIGIGVGQITFQTQDIKKSTGEAFIFSGEALDSLTKESLEFRSPWLELNEIINLLLTLSSRLSDQWTVNMAETVKASFDSPHANQKEITKIVGRKYQSQISTELNKANLAKLKQVIDYCTTELNKYVNRNT